jgi:hypothetical protein
MLGLILTTSCYPQNIYLFEYSIFRFAINNIVSFVIMILLIKFKDQFFEGCVERYMVENCEWRISQTGGHESGNEVAADEQWRQAGVDT